MATNDENFHVQYVPINQLNTNLPVTQADSIRKYSETVKVQGWDTKIKDLYSGITFINGLKSLQQPYNVFQKVARIDYLEGKVVIDVIT